MTFERKTNVNLELVWFRGDLRIVGTDRGKFALLLAKAERQDEFWEKVDRVWRVVMRWVK